MAESEDRTEAPTARRLQRARAEGSVALSRDAVTLAGLAAGVAVLAMAGPGLAGSATQRLAAMLALAGPPDLPGALRAALAAGGLLVLPVLAAAAAASLAAGLLQTGGALNPGALLPDLARLNPLQGLKRIAGPATLVETAKSLAKLAVLGGATWHAIAGLLPALHAAPLWLPGTLARHVARSVTQLAVTVLATQAVIAGADAWWVRHRHMRSLRMSKEEIKQEAKESDGNPEIKRRLRSLRMGRARRRMMAAIPKATVVVTNPTHYAIALAYDRTKPGAPRVVAKGVDEVAARIREIAREHRIPLVPNPPLARALYAVELEAEIPAENFKLVAEIIAYVWRLRGRAAA